MSLFRKSVAATLGVSALTAAIAVPLFTLSVGQPADAHVIQAQAALPAPAPVTPAEAPAPAPLPAVEPEGAPAPAPAARLASAEDDRELTCLAKVVVHEAGNQSRTGQLAVAQVVMNRVNDSRGRFGRTICSVVMQRGQFFNVHAYNPPRNARWRTAMEVARDARDGLSAPVIGNALFFRAAHSNTAFFRGRPLVGRIGGHIFHR
jgi:N-acetylmuramoyl-L-alanine amidase